MSAQRLCSLVRSSASGRKTGSRKSSESGSLGPSEEVNPGKAVVDTHHVRDGHWFVSEQWLHSGFSQRINTQVLNFFPGRGATNEVFNPLSFCVFKDVL